MSIPVFSVPGFINWAETQDPETEYNWRDNRDCLCLKYMKARGVQDIYEGYQRFEDSFVRRDIFAFKPWTIGAALARAKAT